MVWVSSALGMKCCAHQHDPSHWNRMNDSGMDFWPSIVNWRIQLRLQCRTLECFKKLSWSFQLAMGPGSMKTGIISKDFTIWKREEGRCGPRHCLATDNIIWASPRLCLRLSLPKVKVKLLSRIWLFATPWSLPGFSVHGIFQARVLEWVAVSFSRGSSWTRDWTPVTHIAGRRFTLWATREARLFLNLSLIQVRVLFYVSLFGLGVLSPAIKGL